MTKKKPQNTALELGIMTDTKGRVVEVYQTPTARFASVGVAKSDTPGVAPAKGKNNLTSLRRHANWGLDDKLPNLILDAIEEVPIAANAVRYNAEALMGKEIIYVKKSEIQKGETQLQRAYNPEVEAFLKQNHALTEFFPAQAFDLSSLYNGFSELIFNKGFNKIVQIAHKEAEYSRISRNVEQFGISDRELLYYSTEFPLGRIDATSYDNPKKVATLPLYDPLDFNFIDNIVKARQPKFAYHSRPRTARSFYYATMPHQGLYKKDGWIDSAKRVPVIINKMSDNAISMKYLVYVSEEYFKSVMGASAWIALTPKERQEKFDDFATQIKTQLVGTDNVFSSLTIMCKEFNGQMVKNVVFEAVDDRAKNDTWIPTTNAADQQIVQGHSVNPGQIGLMPAGASMDRVSGSSNRQSFNTHVTMNTWLQRLMLSPYQLAADFNGWDCLFLVDDVTHTTTNQQESGIIQNDKSIKVATK